MVASNELFVFSDSTIESTSFSVFFTESKSFSAQSADSADSDVLTSAEEEDFLDIMFKYLVKFIFRMLKII